MYDFSFLTRSCSGWWEPGEISSLSPDRASSELRPGCLGLYSLGPWKPQGFSQPNHAAPCPCQAVLTASAWAPCVSALLLPHLHTMHCCEQPSCISSIPHVGARDAVWCPQSCCSPWLNKAWFHSLSVILCRTQSSLSTFLCLLLQNVCIAV